MGCEIDVALRLRLSETLLVLQGGEVDLSMVRRKVLPIAFALRSTTMIGLLLGEVSLSCGVDDVLCNWALLQSRHAIIVIRLALALTLAFALTLGAHC